VSDVQFKVLTRITLNCVDTIPCIGGADVTLLDVPHIDFKLRCLVRHVGAMGGWMDGWVDGWVDGLVSSEL